MQRPISAGVNVENGSFRGGRQTCTVHVEKSPTTTTAMNLALRTSFKAPRTKSPNVAARLDLAARLFGLPPRAWN